MDATMINSVISGSFGGVIVCFFVFILLKFTEFSLKNHLDSKIKELEYQYNTRLKAEKIADFFSEWDSEKPERKKLNKLAIELSLWLPTSIVADFTNLTTGIGNSKNAKQIIIDVRNYLEIDKENPLKPQEIVYFPKPKDK